MKVLAAIIFALVVAACVRVSLQPPKPEWADWCIKNGGKLKHMYGPIWICDLNPEKDEDGKA